MLQQGYRGGGGGGPGAPPMQQQPVRGYAPNFSKPQHFPLANYKHPPSTPPPLFTHPGSPQNNPYSGVPSVVGTPAMSGSGSVIMIYGLTPGKHNCDSVFNLLCSYGNILKVCVWARNALGG